jgi:hypothetical protein
MKVYDYQRENHQACQAGNFSGRDNHFFLPGLLILVLLYELSMFCAAWEHKYNNFIMAPLAKTCGGFEV